ncbi:uncharacterized protein FFB14_14682 [Fusarium fujikuroi]|nr:uncharacterized protein FFB14_14682 [Fusarium fujikuroi]
MKARHVTNRPYV